MKTNLPTKRFNPVKAGFTLIELLVVIGILGILAVGLLAAIDPIEQFRKAEDNNKRSTMVEYLNAINRYYATKRAYPWNTVVNGGSACTPVPIQTSAQTAINDTTITELSSCTTALTTTGELKTTFPTSGAITDAILVSSSTGTTAGVNPVLCFAPVSKAMLATASYTVAGVSVTPGTGTHICIQ